MSPEDIEALKMAYELLNKLRSPLCSVRWHSHKTPDGELMEMLHSEVCRLAKVASSVLKRNGYEKAWNEESIPF